jgi:hypothetical protein
VVVTKYLEAVKVAETSSAPAEISSASAVVFVNSNFNVGCSSGVAVEEIG